MEKKISLRKRIRDVMNGKEHIKLKELYNHFPGKEKTIRGIFSVNKYNEFEKQQP